MSSIRGRTPLEIIIGVLICLIVGGGILYLGYSQGQRTRQPNAAASMTAAALDKDPARLNPAHPPIPPDATPEMKEFLENQTALADKMAKLRGNNPNTPLTPKQFALFREENSELLDRQNELAKIIAQQQKANTVSVPEQATPPGASPQMQAYLKARESLMRDEITFMNQHNTDSLADRQAAMLKWRKQNAARFQQLEQMAQALGPQVTSTK